MMNQREHALAAAALIEAVGGPKTASDICDLSISKIYAARDVQDKYSLTAQRISLLEDYVGRPIYSRLMADAVSVSGSLDLAGDVLNVDVAASVLSRDVHRAIKDNRLTPAERTELTRQITKLQDELNAVKEALNPTDEPSSSRFEVVQ